MNKFEIAEKYLSATLIKNLFPDPEGYEEKNEWWIKSPIRIDNNIGSFSINLSTGLYKDLATDDKGNLIGLLSESQGISKLEAAEKIITQSGGILPDNSEKRDEKVKNCDKFTPECPIKDENRAIGILKNRLKEQWSIDKWGKAIQNWAWRNAAGDLLWAVIRHETENGKDDIPYFFATDNTWHQGYPVKTNRPLYGLDKFKGQKYGIIVEGQKCAEIKVKKFISLTWPGGTNAVKKTDWKAIISLELDKIVIWPDNDDPGKKAALTIKEQLSLWVDIPIDILDIQDKPKKWDIADAKDDKINIEKFIKDCPRIENLQEIVPDKTHDKNGLPPPPFKILGFTDKFHWFLPDSAPVPLSFSRGSISTGAMLELARFSWWGINFPAKTSFDREPALDWLIQESHTKGYYDSDIIRGAGVWRDNGRIVVNEGKRIITHDGQKYDFKNFDSKYIYILSGKSFGDLTGDISTSEEGYDLINLFFAQKFMTQLEAVCIMGFALIAPFSSFLKWRPHIWLTGRKEIGKSYLLDDIITPLVGPIAHIGSGKDTEAGIRRSVRQDGCPVILDETEPKSQEARKKLDGQLELARNASSDGAGEITIAAANGGVDKFKMRQSFLFTSIVPHMEGAAIASRFIICRLNGNIDFNTKKIATLKILDKGIMEDPGRFRRRIFKLLPVIEKNIPLIKDIIFRALGSQRMADNLAPLFAAVYNCVKDGLITEDQKFQDFIMQWINEYEENSESDEDMVIRELLDSNIRLEGGNKSLGELIYLGAKFKGEESYHKELGRYGIKYIEKKQELAIQYEHKMLRDLLKESPYVSRYGEILKRHKYAEKKLRSVRIGEKNSKAVIIDYTKLAKEYFDIEDDQIKMDLTTPDEVPF